MKDCIIRKQVFVLRSLPPPETKPLSKLISISESLHLPLLQRSSIILDSSGSLVVPSFGKDLSPFTMTLLFVLSAQTYLRPLLYVELRVTTLSWIPTIAQFSLVPVIPKMLRSGLEFLQTRQFPLLLLFSSTIEASVL